MLVDDTLPFGGDTGGSVFRRDTKSLVLESLMESCVGVCSRYDDFDIGCESVLTLIVSSSVERILLRLGLEFC
jgi:hypothetical protein